MDSNVLACSFLLRPIKGTSHRGASPEASCERRTPPCRVFRLQYKRLISDANAKYYYKYSRKTASPVACGALQPQLHGWTLNPPIGPYCLTLSNTQLAWCLEHEF